ncbi:MAG: hypothetical protein HZA01_02595 [Nitrospinae bacterium]|nr:hypothetical protein [Nitrospinota bacterium]
MDYFIKHSGGCPRELLKLLRYAFLRAETDQFDRTSAEKAVLDLASDYKRILDSEDYKILHAIDKSPSYDSSEKVRRLLYNLALLEYNHLLKDLAKANTLIHLVNLENWLFPEGSKSMVVGFNYQRESIARECPA